MYFLTQSYSIHFRRIRLTIILLCFCFLKKILKASNPCNCTEKSMAYDLKEDDFPSCFMYACFFKLRSSIHRVPCTTLPQAILSLDDEMVVSDQTQLKYSAPIRFMIIINLEAEKLRQRTACHLYISQHITEGNISTNVCVCNLLRIWTWCRMVWDPLLR